jgi:carboxypeptidase T
MEWELRRRSATSPPGRLLNARGRANLGRMVVFGIGGEFRGARTRRPSSVPGRTAAQRVVAALSLAALISGAVAGPVGASADAGAAAVSPAVATEALDGADQYGVSVAISQRLFPKGGAPVVYLVSGTSSADGLAAGAVAARDGGAILYTAASAMPAAVADELVRLAPARVEIVGGPTIIADAVVTQAAGLLAPETIVERVSGSDAYGTAASLSARSFAAGADGGVFVTSSAAFYDAIAAGPAAASLGAPVLLVSQSATPAATMAEIDRLAPSHAYIVGDAATVSDAVLAEIDLHVPLVERISGADRNATAVAVARRFFGAATAVVATSGLSFASGLAVAPLAAVRGAPILFVGADDQLPVATRNDLVARRPARLITAGAVTEINRAELIGFSDGRLTVPADTTAYPAYDSGYHDPGEMLTLIRATEIAYPTLVHVFSMGKSYEGRDIWAAKISDNVSVDENEPEVLVDTLHHADEHLGVEQAIYLLNVLTSEYSTNSFVRQLVNEREIWIVFAVNPDGWDYDLAGGKYHFWRKNRQPNPGWLDAGTDINRNYSYKWACCNGSSAKPYAWNYRGSAAFSTPEAKVVRDFVASRVIGGRQQIRTHVTLHTNGELILYPYGYTKTGLPADMTLDDHMVFWTMAQAMAAMNGYKWEQSSSLYITDGDEIDWLYHTYGIFSFTFELYPTEQQTLTADVYPPYSVVPAQTARNRSALLYLIDMAACPYQVIGKAAQYCGGSPQVTPSSGLLP